MDIWVCLDAAEHHALKTTGFQSEEDIQIATDLIPNLVDILRAVVAECKPPEGPYESVDTIYRMLRDPEHVFTKLARLYGFD